jgi:hypothetical protein
VNYWRNNFNEGQGRCSEQRGRRDSKGGGSYCSECSYEPGDEDDEKEQ